MKQKILLSVLTALTLNAATITGTAYADLEKDSKKEALSDLSNKISVDVKSDFKTITKSFGTHYEKSNEKLVELSSNLPLLGVDFQNIIGTRLVKTTATISSEISLAVYKTELNRLHKNISHGMLDLNTSKNEDTKYTLLNQLLQDIENFNKHKIVAIVLGAQNLPFLDVTKSEINTQLQNYIQKAPSIQIASEILTKDIKNRNIYISAFKPNGSNEVTQFAKILKDTLSTKLDTTKYSSDASYFIRGSYEILKNSIFVTLTLSDEKNTLLKTATVTLNPSAYKNTKYKPSLKTFDEAINSEFVKSGKLNVQVGFRGYSRTDGIDLVKDDVVDIVVKTNKPMCYFLLGHTLHKDTKFSYVLPIGSDNSPFIGNITGEDVNRNIIIIDEVPISEPFGNENLQIFASTFKKDGSCPLKVPKTEEDDEGYFVVNGKPAKVVHTTRALNLKKKKFKVEQSEASVSFTSFGQ